ncbi:RGS domain-containing protein [Thamnidium elegans]|nr:RGS domain-containing protein [Thamnidium elegans]
MEPTHHHSSQIVSALDGYALYKVKVDRSCRKLDCFFGETTPVDVCVNEIMKEGLKAILESKVPLCYFLYHLLDEFSSENLFFFLDVSDFENQFKKKTTEDQILIAQNIFDKYISTNANFEINLEDRVKRDIITNFLKLDSSITQRIFDEAKTSTYILLESSFIRFLHTQAYKDMITNCGELTIHYGDQATHLGLNYLVEYLQSQQDTLITYNESSHTFSETLLSLNLQHYETVKLAIQGFIKSTFHTDYLSKKASWSSTNFEIINLSKKSNRQKNGRK